jgi:hypothetical protein
MNQPQFAEETGPRTTFQQVFSFPNPVNESAARLVAGMVVALTASIIIFEAYWLLPVLVYGFLARVLTGPTLSPMGLLATKVVAPGLSLPVKLVSGPPKRFAQTIGLLFSMTALILHFAFGLSEIAIVVLGILVVFAVLESVFAFCAGCVTFRILMRMGLIPDDVCKSCVF